jgi:hypothetical protein
MKLSSFKNCLFIILYSGFLGNIYFSIKIGADKDSLNKNIQNNIHTKIRTGEIHPDPLHELNIHEIRKIFL